jgi:5-methylthioribose kinase
MILEKNIAQVQVYLEAHDVLEQGESITSLAIPGEGNMNFTLRVITNERSMIIKQSRSYVEKYPHVPAPADRCMREAEFYHLIATYASIANMTPELLLVDRENNILLMEDFGEAKDFTYLYHTDAVIDDQDLKTIMSFAANLHRLVTTDHIPFTIENVEMRKLNHEHMYIYPFMEENGFDLDSICEGLQEMAMKYKQDEVLKTRILKMGQEYLSNGNTLLHGDYFPGSWLKAIDGIKIIDPEFCFFGDPSFEIGVTIAHLYMAYQPESTIEKAISYYKAIAPLDEVKAIKCAGLEIMRRILGLAQLPLNLNLKQRVDLLDRAYNYISN